MKCFVIMPFGNRLTDPQHRWQLDLLYEGLIRPAVEAVRIPGRPDKRIMCHRGDTEPRPGEIITHIIENLVQSDIAIADLSGRNANVFYELGVRHAVNDNTILMAQNEEDVPFDLRGQRLIIYQCDFEGGVRLRNALVEAIEDILRTPKRIDNPVRRYLYDREKEKIETPGVPPGYDVVRELLAEVTDLRREFKEQLAEVRYILHAVTSAQPPDKTEADRSTTLEFFEGAWRDKSTESLFCARVISGELLVPYSYGTQAMLTGHFFNCRLIDRTLFARFQWFGERHVSGYSFLRVESENRLEGGWWFTEDVPQEVSSDITRINLSMPAMNPHVLDRIPLQEFPWWAEEYFQNLQSKGIPAQRHS